MLSIFTTINPYGNHEIQIEATKSWSNKYEVYSVNLKEEIEIAKEKYPHVKFIETDDFYDHSGKKLIRLNSILKATLGQDCQYVGIVNSDIILSDRIQKVFDEKYLDNGIIIATRWELEVGKDKYPFGRGYDLFIFKKRFINLFMNENYVLGMPWWDFYIPTIAIKSGMELYHIKTPVIFHKTHETNYDHDTWIKFGEFFYKDIMLSLMKKKIDSSIYDFCTATKKFIEKNHKEIKIK